MSTMREVAELQERYRYLLRSKKLNKKALCDLCIPFRDKYGLTDIQTLQITRDELRLMEILKLLEKSQNFS